MKPLRLFLSVLLFTLGVVSLCAQTINSPAPILKPSTPDTTPTHSAVILGTTNAYIIGRPFRYSDSGAACLQWGPASDQCSIAIPAFSGANGDGQLSFIRDPYLYEARAALYSGPVPNTTAEYTALNFITAGSLNFSSPYDTYAITGCSLASVTTNTNLASTLKTCINNFIAGQTPSATFTGTLTKKTCQPYGYASGAWFFVTNLGTCPKIYNRVTIGPTQASIQLTDGAGNQCNGSGIPVSCNGTTGLYGTRAGPAATLESSLVPGLLPVISYDVLTYTPISGALGVGDYWVQGTGLTSTNVAINDTGVGSDAGGLITTVTGSSPIGPETMTTTSAPLEVSIFFTTGVQRFYIVRDSNFNSNEPLASSFTIPSSNSTAITDNMANALFLTTATGGYYSGPAFYTGSNDYCAFINTLTTSIMTDWTNMFEYNEWGWQLPPGESAVRAACFAKTNGRYNWQPWNGNGVVPPLVPTSTPMFSLWASGGGNTSFPTATALKYANIYGGFTSGVGTFLHNSANMGADLEFWNTSFLWPVPPDSSCIAEPCGFAVGISRAGNQSSTGSDIITPVESMPTVNFSGSSGYPKALLVDWGPGPDFGVNPTDNVAIAYEPYPGGTPNSPGTTITTFSGNGTTMTVGMNNTFTSLNAGTITIAGTTVTSGASLNTTFVIGSTAIYNAGTNTLALTSTAVCPCTSGTIAFASPTTVPASGQNPLAAAILRNLDCTCAVSQGGSTTALSTTTTNYIPVAVTAIPSATERNDAMVMPAAATIQAIKVLNNNGTTISATQAITSLTCSGATCTANFAAIPAAIATGTVTIVGVTTGAGGSGNPNGAGQTISSDTTTSETYVNTASCGAGCTLSNATITFSAAPSYTVQVRKNFGTTGVTAWTGVMAAATFTGSGSPSPGEGGIVNVTAIASGTIGQGVALTGTGVTASSHILYQLSGTQGGIGTYATDQTESFASTATLATSAPTQLILSAIPSTDIPMANMTAFTVAAGDTLDISMFPAGSFTSGLTFSEAMVYSSTNSSGLPQGFIFGSVSSGGFPAATNTQQYLSPFGYSAAQTTAGATNMLLPSLAAYPPTHNSLFTLKISNLTVAYFDSGANAPSSRLFNFWDAPCNAPTGQTACGGWAALAAATGSTASNCSLAAAAGSSWPTAGFNPGGQTTNWFTCADPEATEIWSPNSLDQWSLGTIQTATNTAGTALMWSATARVQ